MQKNRKYVKPMFIAASLMTTLGFVSENRMATEMEIAQNNNLFAFELYNKVAERTNDNIFFSPFSISTALAMTYAGADGQTAQEMAKALHFGPNQSDFHMAYGAYLNRLHQNAENNISLKVANRLWGEKTYPLESEFVKLNKRAYNAPLQPLDYINNPENSRITINDWVADRTEQRIKDLLPYGVITTDTRLVLTNAIYFKGDWMYKFNKKKTKEQKFYTTDTSSKKVPFMHFKGAFDFYHAPNYKMIKLPYKGEKHSMVVVLPNENIALSEIEKEINSNSFLPLQYGYKPNVELALPKFKITLPLNLNSYLQQMGMKIAFTEGADFSKMSKNNNLMISEVIHKAFIQVDEEGTEAAAATAVVMVLTSTIAEEPKPETFIADHPFLFYIVDDETHAILFMGRIMDPKL